MDLITPQLYNVKKLNVKAFIWFKYWYAIFACAKQYVIYVTDKMFVQYLENLICIIITNKRPKM